MMMMMMMMDRMYVCMFLVADHKNWIRGDRETGNESVQPHLILEIARNVKVLAIYFFAILVFVTEERVRWHARADGGTVLAGD